MIQDQSLQFLNDQITEISNSIQSIHLNFSDQDIQAYKDETENSIKSIKAKEQELCNNIINQIKNNE